LSSRYPVDDVESRFLHQAIAAFHADLPDAAAVMLGAAAEHLILVLAHAIADADGTVAGRIEKEANRSALSLLTYVSKYLENRKDRISRRLREDLPTTFAGIASMIRVTRNAAGHPALGAVDRRPSASPVAVIPPFPRLGAWDHGGTPLPQRGALTATARYTHVCLALGRQEQPSVTLGTPGRGQGLAT
jgi:hypothetical protein